MSSLYSFMLTTIGRCKYASESGRQGDRDSRSQFNMQSKLAIFAAAPKNITKGWAEWNIADNELLLEFFWKKWDRKRNK